jgi:hypothetical protein
MFDCFDVLKFILEQHHLFQVLSKNQNHSSLRELTFKLPDTMRKVRLIFWLY